MHFKPGPLTRLLMRRQLAGLCGSDLHIYRGHEEFNESYASSTFCRCNTHYEFIFSMICGHEFIGEVVALGANFSSQTQANRPALYSRLKVGDKIVSPFTVSCGKCQCVNFSRLYNGVDPVVIHQLLSCGFHLSMSLGLSIWNAINTRRPSPVCPCTKSWRNALQCLWG